MKTYCLIVLCLWLGLRSIPYIQENRFHLPSLEVVSSDNVNRLTELASIKPDDNIIATHTVALSPNNRTLALGAAYDRVQLWDLEIGQQIGVLNHTENSAGAITDLDFNRDGNLLAVTNLDGQFYVWDVLKQTKLISKYYPNGGHLPRKVLFSPDDSRLFVAGTDGAIHLFTIEGQLLRSYTMSEITTVDDMALSSNGELLISSGEKFLNGKWKNYISIWNSETMDKVVELGVTNNRSITNINIVGDELLVIKLGSGVEFWSLVKNTKLYDLQINDIALGLTDPSGNLLFTATSSGNQMNGGVFALEVWNLQTQLKIIELDGHLGGVRDMDFSSDGRLLASAGSDGTIRLWGVIRQKN